MVARMNRIGVVVLVLGAAACGKKESAATDDEHTRGSSATGSAAPPVAVAVDAPPPIDAPVRVVVASVDAPEVDAPEAAPEPKLGTPVPLTGALKGLVVQPFDEWSTIKQKLDDVTFKSDCCVYEIHLRPIAVKAKTLDELRPNVGDVQQLLITSVTEVVEQHDTTNGWWAIIKGPSPIIEGDINTDVLRVVQLKGKTFMCSTLTASGAGPRDVRADEVVTACGTLRAK